MQRPEDLLVPTRDGGAGVEGGRDFGVELDHHVALLRDLVVPLQYLLFDPLAEGVAQHRIRHVRQPLARQLRELGLLWVILEGLRVLPDELVEGLDLQRLVLRHLQVLALVVLEEFLPACDQVLELKGKVRSRGREVSSTYKIDSNSVIVWEIGPAVDC